MTEAELHDQRCHTDPSPEQIADICIEIRRGWSEREHKLRAGVPRRWIPPGCERHVLMQTRRERLYIERNNRRGGRVATRRRSGAAILADWIACLLGDWQ